ncbi:hypothetical protein GmHk_14G041937 [Glycine max]|nr:hypothetical protein GmHk_14G041937 [Glycine max]
MANTIFTQTITCLAVGKYPASNVDHPIHPLQFNSKLKHNNRFSVPEKNLALRFQNDADASPSTLKRTRKATRLRSLATRPPGAERLVVNVDPATGKADGPHKKKLRTYLGIVARDKVDVTYDTWKEVPTAQKDLIWKDIQAEFQIPEASDSRTKKKILQIVAER